MGIKFGYKKLLSDSPTFRFIIDGKPYSGSDGRLIVIKNHPMADVRSKRLIEAISSKSVMELPRDVSEWGFHLNAPFPEMTLCYEIKRQANSDRLGSASLQMYFASNEWRYPWSVSDYCRVFQKRANEIIAFCGTCRHIDHDTIHTLNIPLNLPELIESIGIELCRRESAIKEIHRKVREQLLIELHPKSLVTFFDFPEQHAAACKQYIIYFAHFLLSMGVGTDCTLSEEANKVLFTVTPTEGKASLERIQVALAIYLQLPNRDVGTEDRSSVDPAVEKLAKTILHFQSMVGGNSNDVAGSVTNCGSGGELSDKESFWGGRLMIKKFSQGPLEVNLPQILRELKGRFPILRKLE
jgi:ADP-ribose pyrophosphatase YjhB (NUDIX family)